MSVQSRGLKNYILTAEHAKVAQFGPRCTLMTKCLFYLTTGGFFNLR